MMFHNPFCDLTRFEWALWLTSVAVVIASYIVAGGEGLLNMMASLIGVTALIFIAKGYVTGQVLTVIFAIFYGIVSYYFHYYGEMITYLCMTAPIAMISIISWLKHPYEDTKEVEIAHVTKRQVLVMIILAIAVTIVFHFILAFLGNANLLFSTISVTTSFVACYLAFLRSPYYALGYAANDIVLIVLWVMATMEELYYLPMVICFVMFFANDLYGYYNWKKMRTRQEKELRTIS